MRPTMLVAATVGVALGCASHPPHVREVAEVDDPAARAALLAPALDGYHAAYKLTWNGVRIGEARERLFADASALGGYHFERQERIAVRRSGAVSTARTTIVIDLDASLTARRVVIQRYLGPARTSGEATRLVDETWRVTFGSDPVRLVDGTSVPSTLVPIVVAGAGVSAGRAFEAPVLVEGAGLASAQITVDISDDRRVANARIATAAGPLVSQARLDERGFVAGAGSTVGLGSERVPEADLEAEFDPPEIVDASAIVVAGAGHAGVTSGLHLLVQGVKAPPPILPELEHQHIALGRAGAWDVAVDADSASHAARLAEVRERTHHVYKTLASDLGVAALAPDEALAAGRGDCTAHAVVLARLLDQHGFATRLVTGYVLEDGALRRHRWVVVKLDRDWVAVDPTLDEAPASPAHLALAVHGASLDELAFVDDVAFSGWDAARAELTR